MITLAAFATMLLGSCSKINERIDDLEKKVDGLENEKIASIENQITGINSSISDLGAIRSNIQSLTDETKSQGQDITELQAADKALGSRIDELSKYVGDTLKAYATEEWARATFSTLEQYKKTCDTIAKIDARIGALDENLSKKIADCADSLTTWINGQFEGYYTAAEMDAKLGAVQDGIDAARAAGEITDAKADSLAGELAKVQPAIDSAKAQLTREYTAAIDTAIKTLEGKLTKQIQDEIEKVNETVVALAERVINLERDVFALLGRVIALEQMIQSVSIVSDYSDGSVKIGSDVLGVKCVINPASAVKTLKKNNFTILLYRALTKAPDVDRVKITDNGRLMIDTVQGIAEIMVYVGDRLTKAADSTMMVAVNVKNGVSDYTTDFVKVYDKSVGIIVNDAVRYRAEQQKENKYPEGYESKWYLETDVLEPDSKFRIYLGEECWTGKLADESSPVAEIADNSYKVKEKRKYGITIFMAEGSDRSKDSVIVENAFPLDLSTKILNAVKGKIAGSTVVLNLTEDDTISRISDAKLVNLVINGHGHKVTVKPEGRIVTQSNLTIRNVNFDCEKATDAPIGLPLNSEPILMLMNKYPGANQNWPHDEGEILIKDCNFREVKETVFTTGGANWALARLTFDGCVIQINRSDGDQNNAIIKMKGSIRYLTIKNSTWYNTNEEGNNVWMSYGNASNGQPQKVWGTDADAAIVMMNNTIINLCTNKNAGNQMPSKNNITCTIKGNIFYNMYRIQNKIVGNCVKDYTEADNSQCSTMPTSTVETGLGVDDTKLIDGIRPITIPSAALDFSNIHALMWNFAPSPDSYAAEKRLGDPRWLPVHPFH